MTADLAATRDAPFPRSTIPIILFTGCFMVPIVFKFGSLTLMPARFFLLLFFIPSLIRLLSGKAPPLNAVDILVFASVTWTNFGYFLHHGASQIEFIGMQYVELLGGYLFARTHIRSYDDFRFFWKAISVCAFLMFFVAYIELFTNKLVLHDLFSTVFRVSPDLTGTTGVRLGFDRVQGNMEHPILFGTFWAAAFANIFFLDRNLARRVLMSVLIAAIVFTSLSSGAFLAILIQCALLGWYWISGARWKPLLIAFGIVFLVVEIASDRSAIAALSTRLALSSETANWRLLIWEYGTKNVMDHPLFGIGLNEWQRPAWMWTSSVDNYWLLIAMRGGLPAIIFLLAALALNAWRIVSWKGLTEAARDTRTGYLIVMTALFVVLGTVAVWSAFSSFFYAYIGLLAWMAVDKRCYVDQAASPVQVSVPQRRGAPPPLAPEMGAPVSGVKGVSARRDRPSRDSGPTASTRTDEPPQKRGGVSTQRRDKRGQTPLPDRASAANTRPRRSSAIEARDDPVRTRGRPPAPESS